MINVIAILTCKPGQRETVLAAFRANMPAVHAEKGLQVRIAMTLIMR